MAYVGRLRLSGFKSELMKDRSSSGWFLAAVATSGHLVGSVPRGVCVVVLPPYAGASLVLGNVQCWLHSPPIKEANAWQRCDFLEKAGLW